MSKKLLLTLVIIVAGFSTATKAQTVYFNGLGRAIVTNESLSGSILKGDTTRPDRRGTGGYTLFDLGVNAQPNEHLRASAILRIRNEFGGFYGDGSLLNFRQLRLDGVIAKVVKYEIGDIDLALTPYTLFNFDEIYHDYEADIFAIRRSIVHYENFNFGNKWRLQGAHGSSNIRFSKGIEKIGLRAFASRTRQNNLLNVPDRLLFGGRADVVQSKFIQAGVNYIKMADITGTVPDTSFEFNNRVFTIDYRLTYDNDNIGVALYGETGFSRYSMFRALDDTTVSKNSSFYDIGLSGEYKPLKIKLFAQYRYVGYDFSSPGAQTRRIYDMGRPSIFPNVNNGAIRNPGIFDRYSDEAGSPLSSSTNGEFMRNFTIQPGLMLFNPMYNNITPYGIATPNRQGITAGAGFGDVDKVLRGDLKVDVLSEVTGEGTPETRKFFGIRGGTVLNAGKLLMWEKLLSVNAGFRLENTNRGGVNPIDFKSTLVDAGLNLEIIKNLDIMAGYKYFSAKGNEFILGRDAYNSLTGAPIPVDFDLNESILAGGIRYRFSRNTFFTGQYNMVARNFKNFVDNNYNINQVFLNYTMVF
ncbi:MAG: hypothetical protein ACK40G_03105 [Cytophagaceae bacterium]